MNSRGLSSINASILEPSSGPFQLMNRVVPTVISNFKAAYKIEVVVLFVSRYVATTNLGSRVYLECALSCDVYLM